MAITLYRSYTHTLRGLGRGKYPLAILGDPACRFYFGCSVALATDPDRALQENFYVSSAFPSVSADEVEGLTKAVHVFARNYLDNVDGLRDRTRFAKDEDGRDAGTVEVIEDLVGWPRGTFERFCGDSDNADSVTLYTAAHNYPGLAQVVEQVNASGIEPKVQVIW